MIREMGAPFVTYLGSGSTSRRLAQNPSSVGWPTFPTERTGDSRFPACSLGCVLMELHRPRGRRSGEAWQDARAAAATYLERSTGVPAEERKRLRSTRWRR